MYMDLSACPTMYCLTGVSDTFDPGVSHTVHSPKPPLEIQFTVLHTHRQVSEWMSGWGSGDVRPSSWYGPIGKLTRFESNFPTRQPKNLPSATSDLPTDFRPPGCSRMSTRSLVRFTLGRYKRPQRPLTRLMAAGPARLWAEGTWHRIHPNAPPPTTSFLAGAVCLLPATPRTLFQTTSD